MRIFTKVVVPALICASSIAIGAPVNYVGVLYKYRHMPGRSTSTYSTLNGIPSHYNGGEIFYAHRFENDVGIHLGYEQSARKQIDHAFNNGELFLGPVQQLGDYIATTTRVRAFQFNMVGYQDLFKKLEIIGQFGFSLIYADMLANIYTSGIAYNLAPSKGYKFVPTLSLGAQYFIANTNVGIRVLGDWEGTNLYRMKMTDDDGIRRTIRPFKQSWCVTAGLVFKLIERG